MLSEERTIFSLLAIAIRLIRKKNARNPISSMRSNEREVVMSSALRLSIISPVLIAVAAIATTAYLTSHSDRPQSLADYIRAICAARFSSAPVSEGQYLAENISAMEKMMIDMGIRPSGNVDADFVAMMAPHHQGAIEMAQAELRYGHNERLRRLAQEIIVTQQQEIATMRLALGQELPPSAPAPDQVSSAIQIDTKFSQSVK